LKRQQASNVMIGYKTPAEAGQAVQVSDHRLRRDKPNKSSVVVKMGNNKI